jgi:hypothetical protein
MTIHRPKERTMTKAEARAWVRDHFAEFIEQADLQMDHPEEVEAVWGDECTKIAERLRRQNRKAQP